MAYTTEQMVQELWERIGEPSDLDPYETDGTTMDTTSTGWTRLLRALNRGVVSVATFRDPQTGRLFRWRDRHAWEYVTFTPSSDTLDAAITAGDQTLQFTASSGADAYNDYLVKVGNEVRLIVDDDGAGTYTVSRSFDAAHASGATVYFAPRYLSFSATGSVEVLGLHNLEEPQDIERDTRGEVFNFEADSDGDPRLFYRVGTKIYLDRVQFDDTQRFRVEYLKLPDAMTATTDVTGLPEAFDEAVLMWAVAWGFGRYLDTQKRAAARSEFVAEMRMHASEWHIDGEHEPYRGGHVVMY